MLFRKAAVTSKTAGQMRSHCTPRSMRICASDRAENPPVLVLNSLEIPALLLCIERRANALPWNDVAAEKRQQLGEFGISTGYRDGLVERKILADGVHAPLDRSIDRVQSLSD